MAGTGIGMTGTGQPPPARAYRRLADSALFSPCPGSDRLAIFWSGRNMGFRIDKFSFTRHSRDLPVNRLFLRDNFGLWYQRGLAGLTRTLPETIDYLDTFCRDGGYRRIAMAGISAGAYAALLFGAHLGAAVIHSIAPRTLLHPDAEHHADRDRHGVQKSLALLAGFPPGAQRYFDLAACLRETPVRAEACTIHFDPAHSLDRFHARRLKHVPGISFRRHRAAGHALGGEVLSDPAVLAQLAG